MLDSSPVALPPIPRPLKRSASTASLPTPPRSYRKLSRGKSRGSCDSDSDENVASDKSDDKPLGQRHKKRRIGEEKEVDEDAFWLGPPAATDLTPKAKSQPPAKSNTSSTTLASTTSPPVTPETRSSPRLAIRDSPDNPFLATDDEDNYGADSDSSSHEPLPERPTITYVMYVFPPLLQYISFFFINDSSFFPVVAFDANARIHYITMLKTGQFLLLRNLNLLSTIQIILLLFVVFRNDFSLILFQGGRKRKRRNPVLPPTKHGTSRTIHGRRLGSVRHP